VALWVLGTMPTTVYMCDAVGRVVFADCLAPRIGDVYHGRMLRMKSQGYLIFTRLAEIHHTKIKKMEAMAHKLQLESADGDEAEG
jgi:hypothetical protein